MNVALLSMSDALNKGDLAILESTVGLLRKKYPRPSISLFNVDYSDAEVNDPRRFHHLEPLGLAAHYGSFFPAVFSGDGRVRAVPAAVRNLLRCLLLRAGAGLLKSRLPSFLGGPDREKIECLLRADLVILKGGSHVFSHGGLKQFIYLYRMLFTVSLSRALGKKVRALGHSFGPFRGRCSRRLAARSLRRLEKIVVRDRLSRDLLLNDFRVPPARVVRLPDLAFWTAESPRSPREGVLAAVLEQEGIALDPLPPRRIGLTVRDWDFPGLPRPRELFDKYLRAVAEAIEELYRSHGARAFLMPHSRSDRPVAEEVARRARAARPVLLTGDYTTAELRDLYGEMDLFIGTRIHSDLFAFSRGTPVIAIAYEKPKAYGIVGETLGRESVLEIETVTSRDLIEKSEAILRAGPELREEILRRGERLRGELEASLDVFFGEEKS
jgi:polysaccharide pyruvyl transferase WcaK-like protein